MMGISNGSQPAHDFASQPAFSNEDLLVLQLVTKLALNMASEKLSKLDTTRTQEEWFDWFVQQADQRLSWIEDEEELTKIFLEDAKSKGIKSKS
jgi:hypothetical protein